MLDTQNLDTAAINITYSHGIETWVATYDSWMTTMRIRLCNLVDLRDLLNQYYDTPVHVYEGGLEALPTFGGPEPEDDDAWSWDHQHVLYHEAPKGGSPRGRWKLRKRPVH